MSKYRIPPKPPHYDSAQKGQCRYCGKGIIKKDGSPNLRASWHPKCVEEYKIIYWPNNTKRAVWSRDKGKCAKCQTICSRKNWDMDHIQPLVEAHGRIDYWKLPNLQTLCKSCHKSKTGQEATARAEKRRSASPPKKSTPKKSK